MKKYLFLLLAAFTFAACGDDNDTPTPQPEVVDTAVAKADYASAIGLSYANLLKTYGEPTYAFGSVYGYENPNDKVTMASLLINPSSNSVYSALIQLAENAFTEAQLQQYFAAKYTAYGMDPEDSCFYYGNTAKMDDATLLVQLTSNTSIAFSNPKNQPADVETGNIEGTPTEVVAALLGEDIDDLLEEYGDAIIKSGDMYIISFDEEDPYLMAVSPQVEDGVVTSVILLYNEALSDEEVLDYYTNEGYTCIASGNTDEDGNPEYLIMNAEAGILITYCALRGVAVDLGSIDVDDED